MDIRKMFGQNLRRIRLTAGVSQEAVAEKNGRRSRSCEQHGAGTAERHTLDGMAAAQALGCRPAEFLDENSAATEGASDLAAKAPRRKRTKS